MLLYYYLYKIRFASCVNRMYNFDGNDERVCVCIHVCLGGSMWEMDTVCVCIILVQYGWLNGHMENAKSYLNLTRQNEHEHSNHNNESNLCDIA